MSGSRASTSSRSVQAVAPADAASCSALGTRGSAIATTSTPGVCAYARTWHPAISPAPITPTRNESPTGRHHPARYRRRSGGGHVAVEVGAEQAEDDKWLGA